MQKGSKLIEGQVVFLAILHASPRATPSPLLGNSPPQLRTAALCESSVFVYLDVSDKGSDQLARRRCMSAQLAEETVPPNLIYLHSDCYLHMYHAAVRDSLSLADELLRDFFCVEVLDGFSKYFASVSSVASTWRLLAAEIMQAWDQNFQTESIQVQKLGRRYPMSVSAGRWGSIEDAESFLLERGMARVVKTVLQVLSKHMKAMSFLALLTQLTPSFVFTYLIFFLILFLCLSLIILSHILSLIVSAVLSLIPSFILSLSPPLSLSLSVFLSLSFPLTTLFMKLDGVNKDLISVGTPCWAMAVLQISPRKQITKVKGVNETLLNL